MELRELGIMGEGGQAVPPPIEKEIPYAHACLPALCVMLWAVSVARAALYHVGSVSVSDHVALLVLCDRIRAE